jgi:multiple sugar transport system permease protein
VGLDPRNWLADEYHFINMMVVILPAVWAGAGPGSIIYIAALKTVPEEYYESADLDGAGVWRKIWAITLPTLKPLIIINFVGAFIGSFHAAQNVFVMTGGGPQNRTLLIGLEIWYNAFLYLKFGYATALAWILGATLIGFTMYQLRILKKVEFTTAKSV